MKLADFDFDLPPELIAQQPSVLRDYSDLLVVNDARNLSRTKFFNIINYLEAGDVIVFNDSEVLKAKIILQKDNKKIDFYFNKEIDSTSWLGYAKPAKKLSENDEFNFDDNRIIISKKLITGEVEVRLELDGITLYEFLNRYGQMPLPPYIKRHDKNLHDETRYQTVYCSNPGSIAAPTAGLHFTEDLIAQIQQKKVHITYISLHVGSGTFLPIKTEEIERHQMHSEKFIISKDSAATINAAKRAKRRIISVGTTTLRALESASTAGVINAGEFETNIFIKPNFEFQIVDSLITNFHLPKSTLFILVCAFAGYDTIKSSYNYAIQNKMRFFSYGDAMLLSRQEVATQ